MSDLEPVIKWSGSKRSQANTIVNFFPRFDIYYEPFIGGGSVLCRANPKKAICGDICKPLIELWNLIKNNPYETSKRYRENWSKLQEIGYTYYYFVRNRFNIEKNPNDLLFLSRTCVNGLIRFNKNGDFNNSLHYSRKGIHPDRLEKIIFSSSKNIITTEFINDDYRQTTKNANSKDFIYLDPPYFNTKGRYYGKINTVEFIDYLFELKNRNIKYIISLDGQREKLDFSCNLPPELYKERIMLFSGNSPFKKVMEKQNHSVKESLYISWERNR